MIPYYIETKIIDLLAPKPDDIIWEALATTLSRIARFNGRTGGECAYSVAQHSVLDADTLMIENQDKALAGYFLLHDAHEAFIGDITQPIANYMKRHSLNGTRCIDAIADLKLKWDVEIHKKAGLAFPHEKYVQHVKVMDRDMLEAECVTFSPH